MAIATIADQHLWLSPLTPVAESYTPAWPVCLLSSSHFSLALLPINIRVKPLVEGIPSIMALWGTTRVTWCLGFTRRFAVRPPVLIHS